MLKESIGAFFSRESSGIFYNRRNRGWVHSMPSTSCHLWGNLVRTQDLPPESFWRDEL